MRWAEIKIQTTNEAADAVTNILLENGCSGTALQGESPVSITAYLPEDNRLDQRIQNIKTSLEKLPQSGLETGSIAIETKFIEEQDWADTWKDFFHTTRVGKRIVIKPTWEQFAPEKRDIVVEIDPGMAFGTGSHPTTYLCLELLEKHMKPRSSVIDFGTGSGILAIAAAKLGASLVIALDLDETAVRAARANVIQNEMESKIEVHQAENLKFIGGPADLITANIIAETIIASVEEIAHYLRIGGILIASGITKQKAFDVEQSLRNVGFDILQKRTQGEWTAISAVRAT